MENQQTPEGKTHTPLPWKITFFPKQFEEEQPMFFIESEDNRLPNGQRRPEIMADDAHEGNGYPVEQKLADAELIVKAVNSYHKSLHHQEANEINVCFSKPYQNLQRELFGKKKEIESHQEANAELREKNEDLQIMSEAKDMALVELKEANAKLVEANKELVEIAKAYYEHLKTQDHIHGLNTYSDRMKSKITALLQTYETK